MPFFSLTLNDGAIHVRQARSESMALGIAAREWPGTACTAEPLTEARLADLYSRGVYSPPGGRKRLAGKRSATVKAPAMTPEQRAAARKAKKAREERAAEKEQAKAERAEERAAAKRARSLAKAAATRAAKRAAKAEQAPLESHVGPALPALPEASSEDVAPWE